MPALELWKICKDLPEFKESPVVFSQLEICLKDHRKQAMWHQLASKQEEIMMKHDKKSTLNNFITTVVISYFLFI
eukprot:14008788-Ditylum_brightwellii.AAC.1